MAGCTDFHTETGLRRPVSLQEFVHPALCWQFLSIKLFSFQCLNMHLLIIFHIIPSKFIVIVIVFLHVIVNKVRKLIKVWNLQVVSLSSPGASSYFGSVFKTNFFTHFCLTSHHEIWLLCNNSFVCDKSCMIQGDPNQNFPFQIAKTLKLISSDPMLVKSKCIWEMAVIFEKLLTKS